MAGWRTAGTNRRAVGSLDSACEECSSAGLPLRQAGERSAVVCAELPMAPLPVLQPKLRQCSGPAQSAALDLGWPQLREKT